MSPKTTTGFGAAATLLVGFLMAGLAVPALAAAALMAVGLVVLVDERTESAPV